MELSDKDEQRIGKITENEVGGEAPGVFIKAKHEKAYSLKQHFFKYKPFLWQG